MRLDLNCDLGENEPRARTAALLRFATVASIACGGHAGDLESMRFAVKHALKNGVRIGAHPGLRDRANFGRNAQPITPADLTTLLLQQVSALEKVARAAGARLHHIKLHGALYHMVEEQTPLRRAFLQSVREFWPGIILLGIAGGRLAGEGSEAGIKVWAEGFLDRAYLNATRLVPREQPGALLTQAGFEKRLASILQGGSIIDNSGASHQLAARTWCIHSDGEKALVFARRAREVFGHSSG